jgi:hypothetical protein
MSHHSYASEDVLTDLKGQQVQIFAQLTPGTKYDTVQFQSKSLTGTNEGKFAVDSPTGVGLSDPFTFPDAR